VHGIERRANQSVDVPDDRPADGCRCDIQVILIESATTIQLKDTDSTKRYRTLDDLYTRDIRDSEIGHAIARSTVRPSTRERVVMMKRVRCSIAKQERDVRREKPSIRFRCSPVCFLELSGEIRELVVPSPSEETTAFSSTRTRRIRTTWRERHKGSSEEATGDPKRSVIVEFYAPRPGNAIQGRSKQEKRIERTWTT